MKRVLGVLVIVFAAVGCGDGITRVQVSGKLTAKGKPLPGTEITLTPLNNAQASAAHAFSAPDGSFKLEDSRGDSRGVVPGEYMVGLHRFLKKDGAPFTEPPKAENLVGIGAPIEGLPLSLAGPNSPLRVKIPNTGGEITIDVPEQYLKGK